MVSKWSIGWSNPEGDTGKLRIVLRCDGEAYPVGDAVVLEQAQAIARWLSGSLVDIFTVALEEDPREAKAAIAALRREG